MEFTEIQEKWLTALESGKYKQVAEHLCHDGAYCCLGVATHVVNPDHRALAEDGWSKTDYLGEYTADDLDDMGDDEMTCPPDVVDALSLSGTEGQFRFLSKVNGHRCLIALNDNARLTFSEIAAEIRKAPWLVFTNFKRPETP